MATGYTSITLDDFSSKSSLDQPSKEETEDHMAQQYDASRESRARSFFTLIGLMTTTSFSSVMLASSIQHWTLTCPSHFCHFVGQNPATLAMTIQLLSNSLALVHICTICLLINRATRIHWKLNAVSFHVLRFWSGLCVRSIDWNISLRLLFLLLAFTVMTAAPAAIWAGALAPIASNIIREEIVSIPAYRNTSLIREWPIEVGTQGPLISTEHGVFSYSVGLQMQSSLMNTASSASTVNGTPRQHLKLDLSRFTYIGRSYGIGAAVGLEDKYLQNDWSQSYSYHETGLYTTVSCSYNASIEFQLRPTSDTNIYQAYGELPNSGNDGFETSSYLGYGPDAIVAIGVAKYSEESRRMLAIAAGKDYSRFNTVQCTFSFDPTLFRVDVGVTDRTVTVIPLYPIREFYPGFANLTHTLMRQFQIISNVQTTTYVSTLGNALHQSVVNYIQNSRAHGNSRPAYSFEAATLPGLETALTAMADDMLVAYAGAQMYIQKDTKSVSISVTQNVYRIGANIYIYLIFGINIVIVLLALVEWIRTGNWKGLPALDYLDIAAVLIASAARPSSKESEISIVGLPKIETLEVRLEEGNISLERRDRPSHAIDGG